MTDFANQNLQNRSFRKQNLVGADFRGADIRGCNFSAANLSGADFSDVRVGQTLRQKVFLGVLTVLVAVFVGDALSRLVFNTIGQPPLDPNAFYIPILYVMLTFAGASSGIAARQKKSKLSKIATIVTGILCGAIVGFASGFFYPGLFKFLFESWVNDYPRGILGTLYKFLLGLEMKKITLATQGTIVGAILMLVLSRFKYRTSFKVVVAVAGSITSYAATFLWGAISGAFLSTQNFLLGILFSTLTLLYIWLTTLSVLRVFSELKHAVGTSFRGADLTNARFDCVDVRNTDFSKTVGYFSPDVM